MFSGVGMRLPVPRCRRRGYYCGTVAINGSSSCTEELPDSCSLTRSINESVELPDDLFDSDASGAIIIVASNSGLITASGPSASVAGNSFGNSSGNSASLPSGIGKESVNSISTGGAGGRSPSRAESFAGMGADPGGAVTGFVAGLASCELAMPGIGAEPSVGVGGL